MEPFDIRVFSFGSQDLYVRLATIDLDMYRIIYLGKQLHVRKSYTIGSVQARNRQMSASLMPVPMSVPDCTDSRVDFA